MAFSFDPIITAVRNFFGPFTQVFDSFKKTYLGIVNVYDDADKLVHSIIDEVNAWRNFKQDIRIKQRVVQLERAIEKTRDLIEGIPASWRSIVDLVKEFRAQIAGGEQPIEEVEAAAQDVETGGIRGLLTKFPAIARALTKVLGVLAILVNALDAISKSIADVQTIVDEIGRLRAEIEKLDTIFLSQSNKRKTLHLADGGSIRVRVGKLHS